MSIGRPDPNAFKVVTPDAYNQNLAEIARARAALEAYEKMNEAGRSNYDRLMEQEERELEQKIQEGMAARQRLQELRNQKANGYLEGSSRIEEVGNTNATGYDPARHTAHSAAVASTSFAQHHQNNYPANPQTVNNNPGTVSSYPPQHYPYSAAVEHPQSSNYAYNGRPTQFLSHNGIASRPTIQQTYPPQMPVQSNNNVQGHFDTSNNDQHRTSQAPSVQYRPQPQMQSGTSYHPNGPNQSQVPPRPSQSSMTNPYNQRQSYSDVHYQQQVPRTNNASSSLVNALGTVSSSNTASAASNTNTSAKSITPVSSTVPPIASSSRHGKAKDERRPSQSTAPGTGTTAKDPDIIIPTLPTREQVSVCKEYFDKWAARVPPQTEYTGAISCGKHSIKCIKHTDGSIRFLFNLQTGIVHMWASKFLDGLLSTAQQPIDHSPIAQPETIPQPSSSASKPPTNESSTKSTDLAPAANQGQDVSAPVESKEKEPSLSSLQGQDSVSTPQTPTPRPVERRVGTITSPHQADKKRIAQSVLFALGKRRRESDKLPEAASQASKKQALGPIVNGKSQDIPPNAESSKRDSATAKSHTTTNNTESKPTNTIPPTAPPPMQTSTSVFPSLPRIDVPAATPTVVPTSSQQAVRGYPYQNYNQTNFFNPVTAPPNMQYVKFTPLNPYYGWRAVSSASSAAPPSTSQTPVPTSQASEKKSNDSGKTSVSDSTSKTTLPSVGNITKPKVLDNKRRPSKSPPKSLQKDPSVSQPSVPAPTQSSSSVTASNNAVANKNNTADDLIPQIAYLKSPSRKSPEPVASSSKLAPPKEPLFLPSSPSPQNEGDLWGTESARDDIDELDHQQPTKPRMKPKVNLAYVLVPPAPEYLVRYRQRQEKQKQKMAESRSSSSSVSFGAKRRIGTRTNSSVSTPFGEEDFINSGESQPPVLEEEEREAIQLACSRLQVAPCRWDGCDAELNSVEALIRHLNLHKPEATQHTKTFMCRWRQCGQQGIKIEDVHLEKHALLPLRCAYTGCDDTFRSPSQLLRHFRTRHSGDELKPSTKLAPPSTLPDPPPIPGIIPSYLIVTSLAGREVLSKERHNIISPQVLKGMTSEQNAPTRRSRKNARPASRPAPSVTRTDLTNDYNFLENNNSARSSTYFSKASDLEYSDLDSEAVNKIYERGIVLLGSDDGTERDIMDEDVDIELISPPSSPLQRRESRGEVVGVKRGLEKGPNVRPDEHSSDEDAAVETMLTDMTSMGTSIS